MVQPVKRPVVYPQSLEYLVDLHFQEDYETLRYEAQELQATGADEPTRALGSFFYEHAAATLRWIDSYDYEAIRAREEAANKALRAKRDCFPGPESGAVIFALEALSLTVIEGTHIENGWIASDPLPMAKHSKNLHEGLNKAYEWMSQWRDAHPLFIKELEWQRAVSGGIRAYAELLTHFPYDKDYFLSNVGQVEQYLDSILDEFLDDHFETCSELRAHKEFLRHYRTYLEQTETTPYFRNTHISWLLNFQIDRSLAAWLCDQLTLSSEEEEEEEAEEEEDISEDRNAQDNARQLLLADKHQRFRAIWNREIHSDEHKHAGDRWNFPHIEKIEARDSEDYLETGVGQQDMRACIITFKPVQTHLESLADVIDEAENPKPDEIAMALKVYAYGICTIEFSIDDLHLDIFRLRQVSALIAPFAHKSSFTWIEGHHHTQVEHPVHHQESQLDPLAKRVSNGLKKTTRAYIKDTLDSLEEIIKEKGKKHQKAAAEAEVRKLQELQKYAKEKHNWIYASHLNWFTYANPRQMMLAPLTTAEDGQQTLLPSPLGKIDITTLPEFKGLVLPLREKRASLHDWLAMRAPTKRNLAEITSHTDDLFFVSNNSALLYFPDDPNFNVLQFIDLVETAARLYCLVTSMVTRAKMEFDDLAKLEAEISEKIDESGKRGIYKRELQLQEIRAQRAASEHFDSDARRSLDLLTLRVISMYADTTKLMQAITDELEINDLRQLFNETMERINQKRDYLLETEARLQHEQAAEQSASLQTTAAIISALLATAGLDVIITDIQNALSSPLLSLSTLHLLIMLVIITLLALFLFIFVRRIRIRRSIIQQADRQAEEGKRKRE